jgi:hypothetical protein
MLISQSIAMQNRCCVLLQAGSVAALFISVCIAINVYTGGLCDSGELPLRCWLSGSKLTGTTFYIDG